MPDQNGFATMDEEDRSWAELTKRYRRVEHHAMHARKQFPETCSACWREANPASGLPGNTPYVPAEHRYPEGDEQSPASKLEIDPSPDGDPPLTNPSPATDTPSALDSSIDIEGAEAGWTGAPEEQS